MDTEISEDGKTFLRWTGAIILGLILLFWIGSMMPSSAGAKNAVEVFTSSTNVVVSEGSVIKAAVFCSEGDTLYFDASAEINGRMVPLYVCSGFWRGYSVYVR